jgi:hypothetical protein
MKKEDLFFEKKKQKMFAPSLGSTRALKLQHPWCHQLCN